MRNDHPPRSRRNPLLLAFALLFLPLPAMAQQSAGGVLLTFGVEQRLETDDNYSMQLNPSGRTSIADTHLSFSLSSETPVHRLGFGGSAVLRASDGPGLGAEDSGFVHPALFLDYSRNGPGSGFDLRGRFRETELEFMRSLADFDDGSGVIILPDDISDLFGVGTRRHIGADMALKWGQDGPLGFGLRAGFDDYRYRNTSSTSLNDHRRINLGVSTQMQLDPLWRLTLDLGVSRYDKDDPASRRRNTVSLSGHLSRDMPMGRIGAGFNIDKVEEGRRIGMNLSRSLDLIEGSLTARVGASRTAVGHHVTMVGGLDYRQDLPLGRLNASLERGVSANSDDEERVRTALSLNLLHELAEDRRVSLDLSYIASSAPGGSSNVKSGSVGISYQQEVTADWGLDIAYRHRRRHEAGYGNSHSNMVYLSLRRSFQFRP